MCVRVDGAVCGRSVGRDRPLLRLREGLSLILRLPSASCTACASFSAHSHGSSETHCQGDEGKRTSRNIASSLQCRQCQWPHMLTNNSRFLCFVPALVAYVCLGSRQGRSFELLRRSEERGGPLQLYVSAVDNAAQHARTARHPLCMCTGVAFRTAT